MFASYTLAFGASLLFLPAAAQNSGQAEYAESILWRLQGDVIQLSAKSA